MNHNPNGYNVEIIKRKAKKIKKELGITHHEALEKASIEVGFTGWKNFLNSAKIPPRRQRVKKVLFVELPTPIVLTYSSFFAKNGSERPNARMSVSNHQALGLILKDLINATENNKRAKNAIGDIRGTFDDWIQHEYTDKKELSDEVFFKIYYGDHHSPTYQAPTEEEKKQLVQTVNSAKLLIEKSYHDCRPIRNIRKKFDLAIKAIENWPKGRKQKDKYSSRQGLAPGTLIYLRSSKKPALVIRQLRGDNSVLCYIDRGPFTALRHEVSAYRDQRTAKKFKPMRLRYPYGKWSCENGSEVLFNRDYCPIWVKDQNNEVSQIDPDVWVKYIGDSHYYFDDSSAPWYGNKRTMTKCESILKEWGVEDADSRLFQLLGKVYKDGDLNLLKPKNRKNMFPIEAGI